MPASRGNNVILENGTVKTDKVVMRDLAFWLPLTKPHLSDGVKFAPSFETLVKLPIPQIGYILGVVIKIIRKNRKVHGERLSNCTLKVKADAWQRIMRIFFKEEDKQRISISACVKNVLIYYCNHRLRLCMHIFDQVVLLYNTNAITR